jgi:hypothetical protein
MWPILVRDNSLPLYDSWPSASASILGNDEVFSSQASTTRVIWWWNDVLRPHYRMIIRAITKLVICRKSNLCPNQFWTPFVHSFARLQPLLQLGNLEICLDAHKLRSWLCDEHFNRESFLLLELILDVQEMPDTIFFVRPFFWQRVWYLVLHFLGNYSDYAWK